MPECALCFRYLWCARVWMRIVQEHAGIASMCSQLRCATFVQEVCWAVVMCRRTVFTFGFLGVGRLPALGLITAPNWKPLAMYACAVHYTAITIVKLFFLLLFPYIVHSDCGCSLEPWLCKMPGSKAPNGSFLIHCQAFWTVFWEVDRYHSFFKYTSHCPGKWLDGKKKRAVFALRQGQKALKAKDDSV